MEPVFKAQAKLVRASERESSAMEFISALMNFFDARVSRQQINTRSSYTFPDRE